MTGRVLALITALAAGLMLSACSSGGADAPTPTPTPTASPITLQGQAVPGIGCGTYPADPTRPAVDFISTLTLTMCQRSTAPPTSGAVTLNSTDPRFDLVMVALATKDLPIPNTIACQQLAVAPTLVYASTPNGNYLVRLPEGLCGPQPAVTSILNELLRSNGG